VPERSASADAESPSISPDIVLIDVCGTGWKQAWDAWLSDDVPTWLTSAAFDNLIDPVGEQAMRVPVDTDRCVRIKSIDQAEDLGVLLAVPVAQVGHVVELPDLQVAS
jgi:hypothetical protein